MKTVIVIITIASALLPVVGAVVVERAAAEPHGVAIVVMATAIVMAMTILGTLPVCQYIMIGLEERRGEVINYFKPETINAYFKRFFPKFYNPRFDKLNTQPLDAQATLQAKATLQTKFAELYDQHFGPGTYIYPFLAYTCSLMLCLVFMFTFAFDIGKTVLPVAMPQAIASALMGAYLWVTTELLARYRRRDITVAFLYDAQFRLITSIPVALTVAFIFAPFSTMFDHLTGEHFGSLTVNAIALVLGTLSIKTNLSFMRNYLVDKHKIKSGGSQEPNESKYDLEKLQGVDAALAERFEDIGITSFQALAYQDPIKLISRMNLPVRVVRDLIAQALLALYLGEKNFPIYRRYLIRSIRDVGILYEHSKSKNTEAVEKDPDLHTKAKALMAKLAEDLNLSQEVLDHMFFEIWSDRGVEFLRDTAAIQANRDAPGDGS
jgi:hypothetical protein